MFDYSIALTVEMMVRSIEIKNWAIMRPAMRHTSGNPVTKSSSSRTGSPPCSEEVSDSDDEIDSGETGSLRSSLSSEEVSDPDDEVDSPEPDSLCSSSSRDSMRSSDRGYIGDGRSDISGGRASTMGTKRGVGGSIARGDMGGVNGGVGIVRGVDNVVSDGVDDGDGSISLSSFGSKGGGRGGKPAIMPC